MSMKMSSYAISSRYLSNAYQQCNNYSKESVYEKNCLETGEMLNLSDFFVSLNYIPQYYKQALLQIVFDAIHVNNTNLFTVTNKRYEAMTLEVHRKLLSKMAAKHAQAIARLQVHLDNIMALPEAQPAEVLRAFQKDDLYEKQLAGSLARLLPSYHASKAIPVSSLLYKSFTTLKDLQTLGEEYSGIIQVDETYHRLPSFSTRLISILLSAFGENLTRRLLVFMEKQIIQNSSLKPQAQNGILVVLKTLNNVIPQIESIHRALSYIGGGPLQIGKIVSGINYVHVRPAAAAYYAHLRLLGIVTLLHAFISCGQSLYQAKKHMDEMSDFPNEVDSSKSCIACLEEIVQPCVLQCGHLFCMQCCYGALETCPLCRTPFTKNTVVPLLNYIP